jgi:hypothetical protein
MPGLPSLLFPIFVSSFSEVVGFAAVQVLAAQDANAQWFLGIFLFFGGEEFRILGGLDQGANNFMVPGQRTHDF